MRMGRTIDLHIHSSHSEDGEYPVAELFSMARDAGIDAISITDHDDIQSIRDAEGLPAEYGVKYIPGVEVTTVFPVDASQQHILGYFIRENDHAFIATLRTIQTLRAKVAAKRIEALRNIGFTLNDTRINEMSAGRAPTATSIMREIFLNEDNKDDPRLRDYFSGKNKNNRLPSFYRAYFTEGKPAYVQFESIPTRDGIAAILSAGGIPVLAHPVFVKNRAWLDIIRDYGIQGIEAVSTYHSSEECRFFQEYAHTNGLCITAGSDFHGPQSKPLVKMGGISGNDYSLVESLIALHRTSKK